MERERREDLEERDAFAQRVIKRDKEKQRNAAEKVKKNTNALLRPYYTAKRTSNICSQLPP